MAPQYLTTMGVDLNGIARKFGLEPYIVDRLHRRIRLPVNRSDERHRVELVCLAVVTRHLSSSVDVWLRWERTPVDDALDEASQPNPRWTWFDWDCGDDSDPHWRPQPGERVRVFTRQREFIGYARVVFWRDDLGVEGLRADQLRFEERIPEWAQIPTSGMANIGRILKA